MNLSSLNMSYPRDYLSPSLEKEIDPFLYRHWSQLLPWAPKGYEPLLNRSCSIVELNVSAVTCLMLPILLCESSMWICFINYCCCSEIRLFYFILVLNILTILQVCSMRYPPLTCSLQTKSTPAKALRFCRHRWHYQTQMSVLAPARQVPCWEWS